MTLEQWITVFGIALSFVVWFLGHKWVGCKSSRKMWVDLTTVAIPLGLLILSLVVLEYDRTNSLDREVRLIREETSRFDKSLMELGHFEKIDGYDHFVAVIGKEVHLTKSRWLSTRVQTNQAQTQRERAYFETMVARVMSGEITDCRRIVRIPTPEHLNLYRELLERMGNTPSFGIGVWKADGPPFDYELLVGDDVVIFAFGYGAPDFGIRIHDKATADRFARTFDDLWRRSEIIKDKKAISDEAEYNAMIKRMESFALDKREKAAAPYLY